MNRLLEYLEARTKGGHGWRREYENMVMAQSISGTVGNREYLAGVYETLIDDLLLELPEREINNIMRRLKERGV